MLSAASLRLGAPVRFRSRDWAGVPLFLDVDVDGIPKSRLHFKLAYGLEPVVGSSTTFVGPAHGILDFAIDADKYVLHFREKFLPIHSDGGSSIFDQSKDPLYGFMYLARGKCIYVKGIYVPDHTNSLLFDYDIPLNDLSPDRDKVNRDELRAKVSDLLSSCVDKPVIRRIINAARKESETDYVEFAELNLPAQVAVIWKEVFQEFGPQAVLSCGDSNVTLIAMHMGYEPITVNKKIKSVLKAAGIKEDSQVISEIKSKPVSTDELSEPELQVLAFLPAIQSAMGLPQQSNIGIFTNPVNASGTELPALGYYSPEEDKIYLNRVVLKSPEDLVATYSHERIHRETKGADHEDRFREGFESFTVKYILDQMQRAAHDICVPSTQAVIDMKALQLTAIRDGEIASLGEQVTLLRYELAAVRTQLDELRRTGILPLLGRIQSPQDHLEAMGFTKYEGDPDALWDKDHLLVLTKRRYDADVSQLACAHVVNSIVYPNSQDRHLFVRPNVQMNSYGLFFIRDRHDHIPYQLDIFATDPTEILARAEDVISRRRTFRDWINGREPNLDSLIITSNFNNDYSPTATPLDDESKARYVKVVRKNVLDLLAKRKKIIFPESTDQLSMLYAPFDRLSLRRHSSDVFYRLRPNNQISDFIRCASGSSPIAYVRKGKLLISEGIMA